jgi:hypothetical protein
MPGGETERCAIEPTYDARETGLDPERGHPITRRWRTLMQEMEKLRFISAGVESLADFQLRDRAKSRHVPRGDQRWRCMMCLSVSGVSLVIVKEE